MADLHRYHATTKWIGNRGTGTSDYKSYDRNHDINMDGKDTLKCSSDPQFRGDRARHNPEELLVASISSCHMLWYLHLCAVNGIIVTDYTDEAEGKMEENKDGSGQFTDITLNPKVTVAEKSMIDKANKLHHDANKMCFIARSVKFPVYHKPEALVAGDISK
jgi:organic hydroperoxide reductase OsmC/OhrA